MQLPRWYCPIGCERPGHLSPLAVPAACVAGVGPDVAAGGDGGGTVFGGTFVLGESGWVQTEAGWYVNLTGVLPQSLARLDRNPRITRWTLIQGTQRDHALIVPVLLEPVTAPSTDGEPADPTPVAYVSALDQVLTTKGWSDPDDLAQLQERLRRVALSVGTSMQMDDPALIELAVALIQLGHQNITRHEVLAGAWLSHLVLLRLLIAAAAIPQGHARG
jgi:hypothetical protein